MANTQKDHRNPYLLTYKQFMNEMLLAISYEFIRTKIYKKMQNEPNFQKTKTSTISFITRSYEKIHLLGHPQNEPNQTQFIGRVTCFGVGFDFSVIFPYNEVFTH